ncbi:MAG: methyltransferase domain-containing protein [Pseudomonadota bacterium]
MLLRQHEADVSVSADGRNFDDLFERLADRVHGGLKGQLRLSASVRQLRNTVLPHDGGVCAVLDVGAGLGQVALQLAADGHRVTALDISARMVAHIETRAEQSGLRLRCLHGSVQSRHRELVHDAGGFDVVCCHAALEWMTDPEQAIGLLSTLLAPRGALCLLFYNNAALVHRNLIRGNFRRAQAPPQPGTAGGLTPTHALELATVSAWLEAAGLEVEHRFGVRAILDFLPPALAEARGLDTLEALERWLEQREPHWRLARYLHLIARRAQA